MDFTIAGEWTRAGVGPRSLWSDCSEHPRKDSDKNMYSIYSKYSHVIVVSFELRPHEGALSRRF